MIALLQWLLLTCSLVIAILLLWLALTVALNARRRAWAIWLMSAALLGGTVFFLFHATIIGSGVTHLTPNTLGRWPLFWAAGLLLPGAWYLVILWYAGFWEDPGRFPRRRLHLSFLYIVLVLLGVLGLAYVALPFPLAAPMPAVLLFDSPRIAGIPCLTIVYPLCITLCIGLSLDALSHPGSSRHFLGDLARQRTRPWLFAASVALLLVSLAISGLILAVYLPISVSLRALARNLPVYTMLSDLAVSLLIAAAVLLLGQAIVSYEVFTGKTLPRHGLRRHWRRIIILAVGMSAVMATNVVLAMPSIYATGLAVVVVGTFYALYTWRSFTEQERHVASLRPFVFGPPVYNALTAASLAEIDVAAQFAAVCDEVLGVRTACLEAHGPFASLVEPLLFPRGSETPPSLREIAAAAPSARTLCLPLEGAGPYRWAVPLWNDQGCIGVFRLGDKADGRLYTEEEMEAARAAGERFIDTLAGIRLAQRLMQVQRDRLAENQVADGRMRRLVHDDVLPLLHSAILQLSAHPGQADTLAQLSDAHQQLANLLRDMPSATAETLKRQGVLKALHQVVHDEYRRAFDRVSWQLDPGMEIRLQALPPVAAEVVFCAASEAIRNAARYGRGTDRGRQLALLVHVSWEGGLVVVIEDNGVGVREQTPARGNGHGALLHGTMMAVIGGTWATASEPGRFTRVTLTLPADRIPCPVGDSG